MKIAIECDKVIDRMQRFEITEERFMHDGGYADMLLMPLAQICELSVHVDPEIRKSRIPDFVIGLAPQYLKAPAV